MERRLAILDDNDALLRRRLAGLRASLPGLVGARVRAAMVIGSVAAGQARDGSDLDVLLVLREGVPTRADYRWWDDEIDPRVRTERFPLQPVFVARASLATAEPRLRAAIAAGLALWDPEGVFA